MKWIRWMAQLDRGPCLINKPSLHCHGNSPMNYFFFCCCTARGRVLAASHSSTRGLSCRRGDTAAQTYHEGGGGGGGVRSSQAGRHRRPHLPAGHHGKGGGGGRGIGIRPVSQMASSSNPHTKQTHGVGTRQPDRVLTCWWYVSSQATSSGVIRAVSTILTCGGPGTGQKHQRWWW